MSDTPPTLLNAVAHILRRVQVCPNLAWHMVHSESLRLCMESYAAEKGLDAVEFREKIETSIGAMQKKHKARIQELEAQIRELETKATAAEEIAVEAYAESAQLISSLDDLLNYCQLRGESPSIEAIRMALNGRSLGHCLQCLEPVA